jgi:putative transcriptional regulator
MKEELFDELVQSVREGGAILRGEIAPRRHLEIEPVDIKRIRERFDISQREFAGLLGISVDTVQNWEQGRRKPRGAARVLLLVAEKHPDALWDVNNRALWSMVINILKHDGDHLIASRFHLTG